MACCASARATPRPSAPNNRPSCCSSSPRCWKTRSAPGSICRSEGLSARTSSSLPHHMGEVPEGRRGTLSKRFVPPPPPPHRALPPHGGGGMVRRHGLELGG